MLASYTALDAELYAHVRETFQAKLDQADRAESASQSREGEEHIPGAGANRARVESEHGGAPGNTVHIEEESVNARDAPRDAALDRESEVGNGPGNTVHIDEERVTARDAPRDVAIDRESEVGNGPGNTVHIDEESVTARDAPRDAAIDRESEVRDDIPSGSPGVDEEAKN
eukprot:7125395-Pyramimonas_sp.AAC.1